MKRLLISILALVAFSACTHDDSKPAPAKPAASLAATGFGSTDGKSGGPCNPDVLADAKQAGSSCQGDDQSAINACNEAMNAFQQKHPNVNCTYTQDGAVVSIQTSTTSGAGSQAAPGARAGAAGADCAARDQQMATISQDAQSTLEAAVHAGFSGGSVTSNGLRGELRDFDQTYGGSQCPGQTNQSFDENIQRFIDEIDQLQ
jgi:hypothetical protein